MNFKVGDMVVYVKHGFGAQYKIDSKYFVKGKVYKITEEYNFLDNLAYVLNDSEATVFPHQIVHAFHDNKLNRVLYPDYKPKDGYLIKE
jgi:hypothetical protein